MSHRLLNRSWSMRMGRTLRMAESNKCHEFMGLSML